MVVNYKKLKGVSCIVLCEPGEEPIFSWIILTLLALIFKKTLLITFNNEKKAWQDQEFLKNSLPFRLSGYL